MRPSAVPNSRARQPKPSRFRLSPFMAGLAAGLLTAALVALYITQSPLPFVDRVGSRPADKAKSPGQQPETDQIIDPNKGLTAKDSGEVETAAEAGIETKSVSPTGMTYLIQVGAFKAIEDAEQMRARMAILGFEARVSNTEKDGQTLHRVRVGPYSSIEELNKAKLRVSENGIESTVIRVNMN
ncbi:MAG: SPOR domain-containing protein [Burkholderiaceae bacterium]|nr:SPOR domain-containing protein [Burkholderiaceae bacterium]